MGNKDTARKIDKEESVDLYDMPPLEGDEEVKEGKGSQIFTPDVLLTRLPILLAQINAGNSSSRLKNEVILHLSYQHNKITNKRYQNFCFNFDYLKDVDEKLKHETEFIIKSNESLSENKIKNEIEQLLLWAWKQYSWTQKTAKRVSHVNLFLTYDKK